MGFSSMPPWEANEWFAAPKYTEVLLTGSNPQRVADSNPQRVGLIFSLSGPSAGITAIAPDRKITSAGGLLLGTNIAPLTFTHHDWGAMVQAEWFANGPAGQTITVVENLLNDWPASDPDDTKDVRDHIDYLAQLIKAMSNGGKSTNTVR